MKTTLEDILNSSEIKLAERMPQGHQERFETRLRGTLHANRKGTRNLYYISAAVAMLVILTAGILVVLRTGYFQINQLELARISPELIETELFYKTEIDIKIASLSQHRYVKNSVLPDLREIDKSFKPIYLDLLENPQDERLLNALINTYQTKLELLEEILKSIQKNNI